MANRGHDKDYYRPYDSADESGSDSGTESSDTWFSLGYDQQSPPNSIASDGIPNFRAFATQVQLLDAAGRNFSTIQDQITYGTDKLGKYTVYSQYDTPLPDLTGDINYGATQFETAKTEDPNIIMIDSRYRDQIVYPQPTFFSLRLPRTYTTIKSLNFAEVKLLNSFYYFRKTKGNTDISIYEQGRTTYDGIHPAYSTIVKSYIREGTYTIDTLVTELNTQLNYTPLFFDYINGFNDFIGLFKSSGDFFLNFNQPGDTFYNTTTRQFTPNPTINTIVLRFWSTRYAGLSSYTNSQALLAYYYPPLVEYIQDPEYSNKSIQTQTAIGIDPTVTTSQDVLNRILYTFTGINPIDKVVLAVVQANIGLLNNYRLNHTFRFYLVNKYSVAYTPQAQSIYFTTNGLNTSLNTTIINQQNKYFNQALAKNGLTLAQYNILNTNVQQSLAILQGMYSFTQTNFLNIFAVPWSQYTMDYYGNNLNNAFLLRNGINAAGLPTNDSEANAAGIIPISTNTLLTDLQVNPPVYWPHLSNTSQSTIFMINLSTVQDPASTLNFTYDMHTSQFNPREPIVNSNNYFYTDPLTNSGNVVCPIDAAKYTVFEFYSPVRQTIQVETLPRPTAYRLPLYNQSNYNSTINQYFDFTYTFSTFTSTYPYVPNNHKYTLAYDNLQTSSLIQVPGWAPSNATSNAVFYPWNLSYSSSISQYTSNIPLTVNTLNRALYFQFTTPNVPNASPLSNYTYSLALSVQSYSNSTSSNPLNVNVECQLFFYHDRAAFQADVLNVRNETAEFYKWSLTIPTTSNSASNMFTAYPNQTYYVSVRPTPTNFGNLFLRVAPWFMSSFTLTPQSLSIQGLNPQTDPFSPSFETLVQTNFNYAQLYDSNWIQLPIDSNLWPPNPAKNSGNNELSTFFTAIGYDINGVSTDETDYVPFIANSALYSFSPTFALGLDPITKYQYQSNSPYDSTIGTYFYPDSINSIFYPGIPDVYFPETVALRESKIVHYYSVNYIPQSDEAPPIQAGLIGPHSNAQLPYTLDTTGSAIPGYSYGGGEQSTIQLGRGPLGFNFIPQEGIWNLTRIVFRTAIEDYDNDPNSVLQYLGVYTMDMVLNNPTELLTLSTAICVLTNTSRETYTSEFTNVNAGFDVKGGTYYEFQTDTTFVPAVVRPILGYTQQPGVMSDQPESMYTCIAFDGYGTPTPIQALSGSAIPYPFYTSISTSQTYLDGTQAYNSSFGVIYPSTIGDSSWPFITSEDYPMFGPPLGGDVTQSQYAISMPIGTSVVNYKNRTQISTDNSYIYPWTTIESPSIVVGTIPNFLLFQTSVVQIYTYDSISPVRTLGSPLWTLTEDQIYPSYETTSLVAITGNSSFYYFLGFSNYNNIYFRLRLKRYDPVVGVLYDYILDPTTYSVPVGGAVTSFTINDQEQLVLCYQDSPTRSRFCYSLYASTILTHEILPSQQSGIHSMDPQCSTCYWIPINPATQSGSNLYKWPLDTPFPGTLLSLSTISGGPSNWSGLAAQNSSSIPSIEDRVVLISQVPGYSSSLYFTTIWSSNSVQVVQNPTVISFYSNTSPAMTISTGYNGSLWLTVNGPQSVWGTRNSEIDIAGIVESAWQIFYPFQKIVLQKIANNYSAITDLTSIDYPEYPHTQIFFYKNKTNFLNDTTNKWGMEKSNNFTVADINQSGYFFNGYIYNIPVQPSFTPDDYQYITIRGATPTESSETLLRFTLTNKYSLGYITQTDLIEEIRTLQTGTQLSNFTIQYANLLSNFNTSYVQSDSYFGQDAIPNFIGSSINTVNFEQFAISMSTLYGSYLITANLLQSITNYVNSNTNAYINNSFKYIFPVSASNRQALTSPFTFQILWKSSLLPQYESLLEGWGLGYNLGFNKVDTPAYTTFTAAQSFYKILDDYIYLRLNPEYKMNRMDSTAKENLNITRDSTGQVDQFYGKLLLNNFNSYCTTFISNQAPFNPPIGRLDTMYFEWVDVGGTQLNDTQCEWTASLTITESKTKATLSSTIPSLPAMKPLEGPLAGPLAKPNDTTNKANSKNKYALK